MRQKIERVRKDLDGIDISSNTLASNINVTPASSSTSTSSPNTPPCSTPTSQEPLPEKITRITADLKDLKSFYNISISSLRRSKLHHYLTSELNHLQQETIFKILSQDSKVDYLLLKNYLKKEIKQLKLDANNDEKASPLLPFSPTIVQLCEDRQQMKPIEGEQAARSLTSISTQIATMTSKLNANKIKIDKTSAYRAANTISELTTHLTEWYTFFADYDPLFTWWCSTPYTTFLPQLTSYATLIRSSILDIQPGDEDVIIGEPIGLNGLLADLEAEFIPYTPTELLSIAEKEYTWCLHEMTLASSSLGYSSWHDALEHVKTLYVPPGHQPQLVHHLANEAITYIKRHDLITIPPIAESTWRTKMMTPARQKINPFFLGGKSIIVSYPTSTMSHEEKMMSMRGNNIHFSRSTVFHEMIPGHHLQFYYMARSFPHRRLFETPFWIEGWALYWEFLLWERGFAATAENKIGMLFWRMHRCLRIIFSVNFHLGKASSEECVEMLVERGGHERATAEGEVRRSLNGDYSPLYQAGYMLGALQLWKLREEVVGVGEGKMGEKEFHDRVMRANCMPIELLRVLIKGEDVQEDFKTTWRFYGDV